MLFSSKYGYESKANDLVSLISAYNFQVSEIEQYEKMALDWEDQGHIDAREGKDAQLKLMYTTLQLVSNSIIDTLLEIVG